MARHLFVSTPTPAATRFASCRRWSVAGGVTAEKRQIFAGSRLIWRHDVRAVDTTSCRAQFSSIVARGLRRRVLFIEAVASDAATARSER